MMTNVKKNLGGSFVVLASLFVTTAALADDASDRKFNYSVTLTGVSDYLFRGISFTDNTPAFQPFVEFTYGIAYLDFWGSNVGNGVGDTWELDMYAGIRPVTGPVSWDLGIMYYQNPSARDAGDLDYLEFKVSASVTPVNNLTLVVTGYATPDVGIASPLTETIEGSVSYTLPQYGIFVPTLSAQVGYTNAENSAFYDSTHPVFDTFGGGGVNQYTYWNAGLKLTVDKYFMDFRYWDTSISNSNDPTELAQSRFLFSAGVTLP
jgi:uncharacterized protein (TIGR02001 family)